jgi:hypothetical protein
MLASERTSMDAGDLAFQLLRSFVESRYPGFSPGGSQWRHLLESGEESGEYSRTSVLGEESHGYEMSFSRTVHDDPDQDRWVEDYIQCKAVGLPDDVRIEISLIDGHGAEPPQFTVTIHGEEAGLRAFLDRGKPA